MLRLGRHRSGLISTALGLSSPCGLRAFALVFDCCAIDRPLFRVGIPPLGSLDIWLKLGGAIGVDHCD